MESSKTQEINMVDQSTQNLKIVDYLDVTYLIVAFLGRKAKFLLQALSRDFRYKIVPRAMVSLRFQNKGCVTDSTLFTHCIQNFSRIETLFFENMSVDLNAVNKIQKSFDDPISNRFLQKVKFLSFQNITFDGENDIKKAFIANKFWQQIAKFGQIQNIEIINIERLTQMLQFFKNSEQGLNFEKSLQSLKLEACEIQEDEADKAFINLRDFINRFNEIHTLELKGLRIGEHLSDLIPAIKKPQLKNLSLDYNGIEPEFCLVFQMLLNFQTIETLNLSHNWIGLHGLEILKDHFSLFKNLKVLKLTGNKLFVLNDRRTENLKDMLLCLKITLEELYIGENSMENEDFEILSKAFVQIKNLRVLNLTQNRINGKHFRQFLDLYIQNGNFKLEQISLAQNILREDGVTDFFHRIHQIPSLTNINISANKVTEYIKPEFLKFIQNFDIERQMTIQFKLQDLRPKERISFKNEIQKAIVQKYQKMKLNGKYPIIVNF